MQYVKSEVNSQDNSHFFTEEALLKSKINLKIPLSTKEIALDGEIKRIESFPVRNRQFDMIKIAVAFEKIDEIDLAIIKRYIGPKLKKEEKPEEKTEEKSEEGPERKSDEENEGKTEEKS